MGRLLDNVLKTLDRHVGPEPVLDRPPGHRGRRRHVRGRAADPGRARSRVGGFFTYTMLPRLPGGADLPDRVASARSSREALAGLERTREILRERPEDDDPRRTVALARGRGRRRVRGRRASPTRPASRCSTASPSSAAPGTVTALVGPVGRRQVDDHRPRRRVPRARPRAASASTASTSRRVRLDSYRTQLGVVLQETFLFDGTIRENVAFSRPDATEDEVLDACRIARVDEFAEAFREGLRDDRGRARREALRAASASGSRSPARSSPTRASSSSTRPPRASTPSRRRSSRRASPHLMKGRTTFVIAHRLSTIRRADQILVVESGRDRRARHPRDALRRGAAATTRCTRSSTASRRTCSSPRAKASEPRSRSPWPAGQPLAAAANAGPSAAGEWRVGSPFAGQAVAGAAHRRRQPAVPAALRRARGAR